MDNIVAVVVTFNRLSLLQECIKCLRNQTKIINQLIVINNGSTDGTAQWLQVQEDIYTISQENLGGAGGFHRGIKEAYENEYDWVWVMDDDAFPNEDCLEKLLLASGKIQNDHIVLAPVIVEGNKIDSLHRGYIGLTKIQYPLQTPVDDVSFNSQENPLEISFASFIGMFLSKKVIESTGFPKHEYFIFHDDVEYSIRITKSGNSIYLVKDAIIYHKTQISDAIEAYNDYQKIKIIKKNWSEKLSYRRNKYADINKGDLLSFIGKRNWLYTNMVHNGFSLDLFLYIIKDYYKSLSYVLLSKSHNLKLFKLYNQVYYQGITGKFNNDKILS